MGPILYLSTIFIIMTRSNGETSEEVSVYSQAYAPRTVDFRNFFPPENIILDGPVSTTDEARLSTISTQFIDLHPRIHKIKPITPQNRVVIKPSYAQNTTEDSTTDSSFITSHEPSKIRMVPAHHHERGVLDVLLPASRVRTFKNVFDTFRRMLSYTFKKR